MVVEALKTRNILQNYLIHEKCNISDYIHAQNSCPAASDISVVSA